MITNRRKIENITFNIDGHNITLQLVLRYLEVMSDVRLTFKSNIEKACEKAVRVNTVLLSRIMANIGVSNQSKRLLLAKVTQYNNDVCSAYVLDCVKF